MSDALKQAAALAAFERVKHETVIGVGTGSTVRYFIDALADIKGHIDMTVASSKQTEQLLREKGLPVVDMNYAHQVAVYVDGADEVDVHHRMVKGGGGAHTREKILAVNAKQFICIVDASKQVDVLGKHPVAVEVIPMARGYVARQLAALGADPVYREGFVSDNGHIILDVYNLDCANPVALEHQINQITGVVDNGLFAARTADVVLLANAQGVVEV